MLYIQNKNNGVHAVQIYRQQRITDKVLQGIVLIVKSCKVFRVLIRHMLPPPEKSLKLCQKLAFYICISGTRALLSAFWHSALGMGCC